MSFKIRTSKMIDGCEHVHPSNTAQQKGDVPIFSFEKLGGDVKSQFSYTLPVQNLTPRLNSSQGLRVSSTNTAQSDFY